MEKLEINHGIYVGTLGYGKHLNIRTQSIDELKILYPKQCRSIEHTYKSNNWLKFHKKPMRRKPFKKEFYIMDEYSNIR